MQIFSARVRMLARGPGVAVYFVLLAVFGVLVPWQKGLDFLDPVILIAYLCLGGVFAGPAAVQLFADVPRSVGAAVGRVALATVWGEIIVLILAIAGMITVRVFHPGIFPLDPAALIGGVALGAALSFGALGHGQPRGSVWRFRRGWLEWGCGSRSRGCCSRSAAALAICSRRGVDRRGALAGGCRCISRAAGRDDRERWPCPEACRRAPGGFGMKGLA